MQPLDPITLAIIAIVVALVLSALLLLLFATREENYEDVLAAQRSEQEAYLARTASAKPVKQRKKLGKGKKKYSDDGEVLEEISSQVEETIEASASNADDEGFLPSDEYSKDHPGMQTEEKIPLAEEKASSGVLKERQGKKKTKKNVPKEEAASVTERHATFERPREDMEEIVTEVDVVAAVESEPEKPVDFETEEQKFPESNGTATSGKKAKTKTKITKDKGPIQQGELRFDCKLWYRIIFPLRKFLFYLQAFMYVV